MPRHGEADRNRARAEDYAQTRGGVNTGLRWQPGEDARILAEDRPTDRELAQALGRSVQAIQARRLWYRRQGITTYAVFHMTPEDATVYHFDVTDQIARLASPPLAYDDHDETLFQGFDPPPVATPAPGDEGLSAGRRFTARVVHDIHRGIHPLMKTPLHDQARTDAASTDPRHMPYTCGTCCHRDVGGYPKCDIGPQSHAVTTDVRAWWPACPKFEPIDPRYAPPPNPEPQSEAALADAWIRAYTPKQGGLAGGACREPTTRGDQ